MRGARLFVVLAGVAVVIAVLVLRSSKRGEPSGKKGSARETVEPPAPARSPPPADRAAEARRARDMMRAQILEALRKHAAADAGAAPHTTEPASDRRAAAAAHDDDDLPQARYDANYIRLHFREDMLPLLKQCYEGALTRRPTLAGKLVLNFAIVGDPSVGGIVEDADIADTSDLQDDELRTCARESLMTLTFDKPPSGGKVTVTYPVVFSPEPPSDAAEKDAAR